MGWSICPLFRLENRYISPLFSAASIENILDQIDTYFQGLDRLLNQNKSIGDLLQ